MSRFPIKQSKYWKPLLLLFGATEDRAFLDVGPHWVVVQFGWKRIEIPRETVELAEASSWPWWGGIGWRSDLRHTIGFIGASRPILHLHFSPQPVSLFSIPHNLTDLFLSVDDPAPIVRELDDR